jgi:hypothetical protein
MSMNANLPFQNNFPVLIFYRFGAPYFISYIFYVPAARGLCVCGARWKGQFRDAPWGCAPNDRKVRFYERSLHLSKGCWHRLYQ